MKKLILVDYDGVCVKPGLLTYDSIKMMIDGILEQLGYRKLVEDEWERVLKETTGTTELNLLKTISTTIGVSETQFQNFRDRYLYARSTHQSLINPDEARAFGEDMIDQSYPDIELFLRTQVLADPNMILMLVTGNPSSTMRERLRQSPEFENIFLHEGIMLGAFSEEALTREGLIKIAIDRAIRQGFEVEHDINGYIANVFYIGDAPKDLEAGVKSNVRTIYLPRGKEKDPETLPNTYLRDVLHTLDISNEEIDNYLAYDGRFPMVFYTSSGYNPQLATFIRPELHVEDREAEMRAAEKSYLQQVESSVSAIHPEL